MKLMRLLKRSLLPVLSKALVLLGGASQGSAQALPESSVVPLEQSVLEANETRRQRTARAMGVLLGWSGVNVATGTWGYFTTEGSTRYFHQMNLAWNTVNAAIAGFGLAGALREDPRSFGSLDTLEEGRRLEKILLLNVGLNVGYIATGAYLWDRGLHRDDERLIGYGPSLVMQGGFLLLFDSTLFLLQNQASNRYLDNLRLHWNEGPRLMLGYTW